jgi:Tfp pilus assembly protein PilF
MHVPFLSLFCLLKMSSVARGIGYAKQGDYTKAMTCYKQALEVDPDQKDAYVGKGAV